MSLADRVVILGFGRRIAGVIRIIGSALDALKQKRLTTLLAEQKLKIALSFTARAYALTDGRRVLEGSYAAPAARTGLSTLQLDLSR